MSYLREDTQMGIVWHSILDCFRFTVKLLDNKIISLKIKSWDCTKKMDVVH